MGYSLSTTVKNFLINAIALSPIKDALRFIQNNKIVFIAYHGVISKNTNCRSWTMISEIEFIKQMEYIKKYYDCLSIEEAIRGIRNNKRRPGVVVTFDDGYANNFEVALPILKYYKIPATIYITSGKVLDRSFFWSDKIWAVSNLCTSNSIDFSDIDKALKTYFLKNTGKRWFNEVLTLLDDIKKVHPNTRETIVEVIIYRILAEQKIDNRVFEKALENFKVLDEKQVKQLSLEPLITIGSHTHCHSLLDQITIQEAYSTISISKIILEKIAQRKIKHFAYPNGNYNLNSIIGLQTAGFISAVTYRSGFFRSNNNLFEINRIGIGTNITLEKFGLLLTGIFTIIKSRLMINRQAFK